MNKDATIITTIFFLLAFFSFKYFLKIYNKKKRMIEVKAIVTDVIVRTTYNKKFYMYFYTFSFQDEKVNISDKKRFPFFQNRIKIYDEFFMYVNPHNMDDYVTPIEGMTYKFYLFLSILFILLPLLFFK